MISSFRLKLAIQVLSGQPGSAMRQTSNEVISAVVRQPRFEHVVHMPLATAACGDNRVYPHQLALDWLLLKAGNGEIGVWDSCVVCEDGKHTVAVSFASHVDAIEFSLRWVGE